MLGRLTTHSAQRCGPWAAPSAWGPCLLFQHHVHTPGSSPPTPDPKDSRGSGSAAADTQEPAPSDSKPAQDPDPSSQPAAVPHHLIQHLDKLKTQALSAASAFKLQLDSWRGSLLARAASVQAPSHQVTSLSSPELPGPPGPGRLREAVNKVQKASQVLNELTGYSAVEALKQQVVAADQALHQTRSGAASSKQAYEAAVANQIQLQKDMNKLLERKARWSDEDVQHFAFLCREEGKMSSSVESAHDAHEKAVAAVEQAQAEYLQAVRERYTEEQLWGDKIRRAATWYTWGLMGLQLLSFVAVVLVVEPRRVRLLQERVGDVLDQHESKTVEQVQSIISQNMKSLEQLLESQRADVVMQTLDGTLMAGSGSGVGHADQAIDTSKMMSAVATFMDGVHQELIQQRLQLQRLDSSLGSLGTAVSHLRQPSESVSPQAGLTDPGNSGHTGSDDMLSMMPGQTELNQQHAGTATRKQLTLEQMVGVTAAVSAGVGALVGVLLVTWFSPGGAR